MTDREQFNSRVVPIMDRVRDDLRAKQAEEVRRYMRSPAYILAGGVGPDGGMGAQAVALDSLNVTGEWNSKTVEDYVSLVKEALHQEHIEVSPELEEMMLDKMVRDQMPKSSIEYVLRKAGGNSIFGLVNELRKSPLQREIDERGEQLYNPSPVEKGIGWGLGAAADFAAFGGFGGGVASGLKFVGADLAINAVVDTVDAKHSKDVPKVVLPGHEEEWLAMNGKKDSDEAPEQDSVQQVAETEETVERVPGAVHTDQDSVEKETPAHATVQDKTAKESELREAAPAKSNLGGWQGILTGLGLTGISDIGRNAGYILAMLPDMLLGMFTGKTKSLGLKENLMPIASIMAGLFVKNPLLKMTLIGLGGANLINKAGHEQLAMREGSLQETALHARYRQYDEEVMNPRIRDAEIRGKTLIAAIDGIPVTIALPDRVVDAYAAGALPLGTLANAVLQRCDQMQQLTDARERFEEESRTEVRGITQR